jgi:indole-3-glycerol phosphate synthase
MSILDRIVYDKKNEVAAAASRVPLAELKAHIADSTWVRRGFGTRLQQDGVNIIAEIKRASPSRGDICPQLDASVCAREYEAGGAAAISVLTDGPYFKGTMADLRAARAATRLPVLRKEFIIDEYQIYEARAAGADAVLLIVRILPPAQLKELLDLAADLGMDALVEIHEPADLTIARRAGAHLIGINNRNLATFETRLETAYTMARRFQPDEVAVAASGIAGPKDIETNLRAGIRNFLIGESLVRAADRTAFMRALIQGPREPIVGGNSENG